MTKNQAYLDALNSGRRRRPTTSIEELNRTLAALESRIAGRHDDDAPEPSRIAADIEASRAHEASVEAAGSIAAELKLLRDDLNEKVTVGIEREFSALKSQIEGARARPAACQAEELGVEIERLGSLIQALAARGGEENATRLQAEMDEIKLVLAEVAREKTLQSVEQRWDDFDKKFDAFTGSEAELARNIQLRLEQIGTAVGTLPEPATMRALDDKLKVLAAAMDRFAQKQGPLGDGALELIDERLDEISRAIAASATTGRGLIVDGKPFERIEARISSLAKQIDELIEDRPALDIGEQIAAMSQRIDELASRAVLPEETITRLAEQVNAIAGKVDAMPASPDLADIFSGVDTRFAAFSKSLDARQDGAIAKSEQLFADLDMRLTALATRMEAVQAGASPEILMSAMDQRFVAFADSFETRLRNLPGMDVIDGFEKRLDGISQRLESTTASLASIDPELVRSLEAQVKTLSDAIASPANMPAQFEDVAPRLERLEQTIADNHAAVLDAARQAAEEAVRAFSGSGRDNDVVQGLADDLRSLEALARRSDERNTKTFEAIHDTLLKIVERLGSIERDDMEDEEPSHVGLVAAPAMEADIDEMSIEAQGPEADLGTRTPKQAALDAAGAAVAGSAASQRRSMIARVLGRKPKDTVEVLAATEAVMDVPELDLDAPIDPAIANQPLEPGMGSPDLSAIIRRVRDERGAPRETGAREGDNAKSDFIAAARRAAQAAAAEAETMKSGKSADGSQRFSISKLLKSRNKVVMMGIMAVTLALAGMQIGKGVMADDEAETAKADVPAKAVQIAKTEAATPVLASAAPVRDMTAMAKTPAEEKAKQLAAPVAAKPVEKAAPAPVMAKPEPVPAKIAATAAPAPGAETQVASLGTTPASLISDVDESPSATTVPADAGNAALREAAESGDPKAFYEIANRYAEGRGVAEDMKAAALWYESAAEEGLAPAQYRIGNMYEKGTGVERDIERSKEWYEKAARQGNASAMHNLAVLHAMGASGTADNVTAARYFDQAAELGVRDSQFNMGILAAKGVGISQNLPAAYKWFAIVADSGDRDAATKRDEVARLLEPADLDKAKQTAKLWKPKSLDVAANSVDVPAAWSEGSETTASIDLGEAVKRVQAILNAKGYDAGQPDGIIGERTKSAIATFQKANSMEPTGEIDEPLIRALLATS